MASFAAQREFFLDGAKGWRERIRDGICKLRLAPSKDIIYKADLIELNIWWENYRGYMRKGKMFGYIS